MSRIEAVLIFAFIVGLCAGLLAFGQTRPADDPNRITGISISITRADGTTKTESVVNANFQPTSRLAVETFLGLNTETEGPSSRQAMLADAMKSATWPFGSATKPFDPTTGPLVDANGDPRGDFGARVITNGPATWSGTYHFVASGKLVTLKANGAAVSNVQFDGTATTADVKVATTRPFALEVIASGATRNDGSPGLQNVRLYRPGTTGADTFNPAWLKCIAPFAGIRFMGAQDINRIALPWSPPVLSDATYTRQGKGFPVELAFGNELSGKFIYVNVADTADDQYIRRLGSLIGNRDKPVYVEYSNEISFNWRYPQTTRNANAAIVERLDYRARVVSQSIRVRKLLIEGGASPASLRMVLPTQTNTGVPGEVLKIQLDYLASLGIKASDVFYGVATAPYMSLGAQPATATVDDLVSRMNANAEPAASTPGQVECARLAAEAGLVPIMYECGCDPRFDINHARSNTYLALKDIRSGDALARYVRACFDKGGAKQVFYLLGIGREEDAFALTNDPNDLAAAGYVAVTKAVAP